MAARYWVGGTASWDNTAGTKWALTDGGAGGQAVPTSADDVFFTALSGAITVTITTSTCKSLTFTGFTGTLAGSAALTVAGSITLAVGMTLTYTGTMTISAASTMTSVAKTFTGSLSVSSGVTATLADDWVISGSFTSNGTPLLIGGKTLTVAGNFNPPAVLANNCNIRLNGTGTLNGTISSSGSCLITINTAGTITLGASLTLSQNVSFTKTSGTVLTGTNTLTLSSVIGIYDISAISLHNLTIIGISNITLGQNMNVTNLTTLGSLGQTVLINGNTLFTTNLTKAGTTATISGTTNITITGGNWTDTTTIGGGYLSNDVTIAGNVTLVGTAHRYRTGTITYSSGTFNPGTSTFTIDAAATLNTVGMSFNNLSISGTTTITNNSLLTVTGTLAYLLGSTVTFTGTTGWTAATFDIQTSSNVNHILKSGLTYTVITNFISVATTNALKDTLKSSTPGVQAIFTLNQGANQSVGFTNATDINSSLGQAIYVANGTLSNTTNWNPLVATDMGGGGSLIFVN